MNFENEKFLIITVVGFHAGEALASIFSRKQKEIQNDGKTYWLLKSFKVKNDQIQEMCKQAKKEHQDVYCLFISASVKNGAKPTLHDSLVKQISEDNIGWAVLPEGIKITGKIDKQTTALVLDELEIVTNPIIIDLWKFSEFLTSNPVKLQLGASTICVINIPSVGMKSRSRNIIAWGKLKFPYAVWVK